MLEMYLEVFGKGRLQTFGKGYLPTFARAIINLCIIGAKFDYNVNC